MKKTSEISKIVGVSKRTLQFYDDEGMIEAARSDKNYRLYDERAMDNLWEIMLYKEMGFTLREIKRLLCMSEQEKEELYKVYVENINGKIKGLEEQKEFVALILLQGLPPKPLQEDLLRHTYRSKAAELKKKTNGGKKDVIEEKNSNM